MDLDSISLIVKKINQNNLSKTNIKNILITGCSGFISTYLIESLLNKNLKNNFNIYGLDVVRPNFSKTIQIKKFHFIKKNLFKIKKFNIDKKIDLIVHLAGIPSPTFYKQKPIETFYLNSEVCKIFLELANKKNAKFIYFSSSEIYGNPDVKNIPTKERYEGRVSSIGDRSCYDESKRAGETYTWIYKNIYNLKCSIIRPFNFYGNGMKKNDKRVIPQFFYTALRKNFIKPFGNGKQTRSYCHIIDAIPQIINVCFFGKEFVYNIGNDQEEISATKLAIKINTILKNNNIKKKIKILKINYPNSYPSNEPLRRCPNISRLKKEFRYRPSIDLNKGLNYFFEYAKKNF
jgi:UDP-glucuronate decarboxylase